MWETWVPSLGQEDLLEKEMATHSSILAWEIPWTEKPVRLQSTGSQRVRHFESQSNFTFFSFFLTHRSEMIPFSILVGVKLGSQLVSHIGQSEYGHKLYLSHVLPYGRLHCGQMFLIFSTLMAPHSSTLAWKIPWMEEPGRLQSMGSLGVGHD